LKFTEVVLVGTYLKYIVLVSFSFQLLEEEAVVSTVPVPYWKSNELRYLYLSPEKKIQLNAAPQPVLIVRRAHTWSIHSLFSLSFFALLSFFRSSLSSVFPPRVYFAILASLWVSFRFYSLLSFSLLLQKPENTTISYYLDDCPAVGNETKRNETKDYENNSSAVFWSNAPLPSSSLKRLLKEQLFFLDQKVRTTRTSNTKNHSNRRSTVLYFASLRE